MTRRTKWRKFRGRRCWGRIFLGLRLRVADHGNKWGFIIGAHGVVDRGYPSLEGAQNAAEIRARLIRAKP